MKTLKPLAKKIFWILYLVVLAGIGTRLFFEDQFNSFASLLTPQKIEQKSGKTLTIGYAFAPESISPLLFDSITRSRLNNIYEGLVRTNRNLKIEPALAISWGLIDSRTWEFKIRQDVTFHNGKNLEIEDIIESINQARNSKTSELANLLNTISEVQKINRTTIHIKTSAPDPLLLNKLAVTYIFPENFVDFKKPVGTGPYLFTAENNEQMDLEVYKKYWGDTPTYRKVTIKTIPEREKRIAELEAGTIDLLADVPPASAKTIQNKNIQIHSIPSLEVNFLMVNLKDQLLKNKEIRKTITKVLDQKVFVEIASGYAHPVSQFISTGVFGFNPTISLPDYKPDEAREKMDALTGNIFERLTITLDYPKGLDPVAQYIQNQLNELGFDTKLNPLAPNELQIKIKNGNSQAYYLGWKSELGDASDFLNAVVHSSTKENSLGEFNGNHYENKEVDHLIENTTRDMDPKNRLKNLQKIMKIIVEEDIIGIPLFETYTLFASNKKIHFIPRLDGYIYAAEIQ